eukprot:CAMPEP_0168516898 /NCGR_PEP_ID=MMETSP0405-20121227/5695_1 /TAXON_ID=498012 /ORGANISM="Trichosphaerium sp, Strain Am-I-7 wt" /LENGTH=44 /DNA_ID= /DNA_START= /DNA_END= /DNA_ORIENTATION=
MTVKPSRYAVAEFGGFAMEAEITSAIESLSDQLSNDGVEYESDS